jgi:hypothetical protein
MKTISLRIAGHPTGPLVLLVFTRLLKVQATDYLAKADAYPARRLRRKVFFPERGDLRVQRNSYLEAEVSPLVR